MQNVSKTPIVRKSARSRNPIILWGQAGAFYIAKCGAPYGSTDVYALCGSGGSVRCYSTVRRRRTARLEFHHFLRTSRLDFLQIRTETVMCTIMYTQTYSSAYMYR